VFADHGAAGNGEPLAILLRPGNAGSNTAADHIIATKAALAQLPAAMRKRVLIRTDSGGGTHEFLNWLTAPGRRLAYSTGFTIGEPAGTWNPAHPARQPGRPAPPATEKPEAAAHQGPDSRSH
jgi:Transposase DDE domain group 1